MSRTPVPILGLFVDRLPGAQRFRSPWRSIESRIYMDAQDGFGPIPLVQLGVIWELGVGPAPV